MKEEKLLNDLLKFCLSTVYIVLKHVFLMN